MLRRSQWRSGERGTDYTRYEDVVEGREWPVLPEVSLLPGQYLRVQVDFIEPLPDSLGRKLYEAAAGVLGGYEDRDPVPWAELTAARRQAWEELAKGEWK